MNREWNPYVGEIVLLVGDEKNKAEWKRGKVVQLVKVKNSIVKRVKILTKGHTIERPLSTVRSLEIETTGVEDLQSKESESRGEFEST